jgi:hypothetical protein
MRSALPLRSDHPDCVDPVIRHLCIAINDHLPSDAERDRVIGPHLYAPVGTAQGRDLMQRRAFRVADEAVRVWAPMALDKAGRPKDAARLRSLPPIVDRDSAMAAKSAADAADAADAAAYAAAAYAADAADADDAYAADADADADADYAAYAAAAASATATYAAYAAAAEHLVLPLVLELCAMGREDIPQQRSLCDLPQAVTRCE